MCFRFIVNTCLEVFLSMLVVSDSHHFVRISVIIEVVMMMHCASNGIIMINAFVFLRD